GEILVRSTSPHRAKSQSYTVKLHSEAELDLAEVFTWYEAQETGLGDEFLDEAAQLLRRLGRFPCTCPAVEPPFRRALFARFPYAVYYLVEIRRVMIFAILHQRREPDVWKRRFGN
ncbi:MAG: type II toxin-antitoxin system RelE/ParE family toxin, partial [Nevskiales bacterium]